MHPFDIGPLLREKYVTKREGVMESMESTSAGLETAVEEDFGDGKFAKYQKVRVRDFLL